MPRFGNRPTHFDVTMDVDGEPVTLKVRWTPEADDRFACLYRNVEGRLEAESTALLALLKDTVETWEGVLNVDGEPIPYSPQALSEVFSGGPKIILLQRFQTAAWLFGRESAANPT